MTEDSSLSESEFRLQTRYKVHGRKKGFLHREELLWLPGRLADLAPPLGETQGEILHNWGTTSDQSRLWLEIGFGNGEYLAFLAACFPQDRFIGVDVFQEGLSAVIRRMDRDGLKNIALLEGNALEMLETRMPQSILDRVVINFPDPWPKKRHHKRRLIQPVFLDQLSRAMVGGGVVTLATDWGEYGCWMMDHLEVHGAFLNMYGPRVPAPEPHPWCTTGFQRKGEAAGRSVLHLAYEKIG